MAICGHQFRAGDESDWILSTSAFLGGSSTASHILQELFKKHYGALKNKNKEIRKQKILTVPDSNPPPVPNPPQKLRMISPEKSSTSVIKNNRDLIIKKISRVTNFDNFDESQHLNGCPVKWLYNQKLLESNRNKAARWCSKKYATDEPKKEKNKNLRDKTPSEVKIRKSNDKINLMEKYTSNGESYLPTHELSVCKSSEPNFEVESHRRKLAAKLNWKLHDESSADCQQETLSEISSIQNYLPPRPLTGLKPLLSILLTPQQDIPYCSIDSHFKKNSQREEKMEASLSVQSLDFPVIPHETKIRPRTTNTPSWKTKSSRSEKKFQIPNQISISLRDNSKTANTETELKVSHNPITKKSTEKAKPPKSLSSLFYELKDKANGRNVNQEDFEEMIRNLTMDETQFNLKRFFNSNVNVLSSESVWKHLKEKKIENEVVENGKESNLVCGKVRFFEKISHSKKLKQEENLRKNMR